MRHSATRFGAKIVEEREFKDTGGARRTDSGIVEIQRQMPVLTQSAPDYDVLVAADESEVFAGYLPYRTWDARPVAGSAGLVPTSWDAAFDQWGAIQLQSRFGRMFHRFMTPLDMQAWSAARMVGEAATRTNSGDPAKLLAFIKSPDFSLAAFKGQKLTLARLELAIAAADPAVRRPQHRVRLAAGGLSASGLRTRYARPRPPGNEMQIQMTKQCP